MVRNVKIARPDHSAMEQRHSVHDVLPPKFGMENHVWIAPKVITGKVILAWPVHGINIGMGMHAVIVPKDNMVMV